VTGPATPLLVKTARTVLIDPNAPYDPAQDPDETDH
jgi:hypothetical protein